MRRSATGRVDQRGRTVPKIGLYDVRSVAVGRPLWLWAVRKVIPMLKKICTYIRPHPSSILCAGVLCAAAVSLVAFAEETKPANPPTQPGVLFSAPLPDVPGKKLVVVPLKWPPATQHTRVDHRHPGSVYVYVTEGTVRLGIEGQPVQELHAGESFFEPPGALHTIAESASTTQPASAIAVMIVPEGAPLLTREHRTDTK